MSYLPIGKDDGNHNVVGNPDMELREQDRWLPIANVARLMKSTLPMTAKVSKDAKECMQECVSEFISFITSEASDKCLREKRKTINGEDVLYSLHDLGFENYAEVLKIYLAKYREQQALKQERGEVRASKKLYKKRKQIPEEDAEDALQNGDSEGNPEDTHAPPLDLLAYTTGSPGEKGLNSPDYFQHYGPEDADAGDHRLLAEPAENTLDIKHEISLLHDISIDEKSPAGPYQYGDFIHDQGDVISKDTHEDEQKTGNMDNLAKLEDQSLEIAGLDEQIPERTYY